jgi:hypothetical protein
MKEEDVPKVDADVESRDHEQGYCEQKSSAQEFPGHKKMFQVQSNQSSKCESTPYAAGDEDSADGEVRHFPYRSADHIPKIAVTHGGRNAHNSKAGSPVECRYEGYSRSS